MSGFEVIESQGRPIKAWTRGVPIEASAMQQLRNVASLPFIHSHVAVMPDVHWGMGATVGSVIPTVGAIIPAAVGVDIGCGMMAVKTSIRAEHLPDSLAEIRSDIEAAVPHGRTDNGGRNDVGAWLADPPALAAAKWSELEAGYGAVVEKHPKAAHPRGLGHLGTLGTGNHFIELCLDEDGALWVMLHSGSRGVGNKFGTYFIERAKHEMRRWFINLQDQDLAYFPEGSEGFIAYIRAVSWAQKYARANREVMMEQVLGVLSRRFPDLAASETAVNCHHNYVTRERHFGKDVFVTRKGAVRAPAKANWASSRARWGRSPSSSAARVRRSAYWRRRREGGRRQMGRGRVGYEPIASERFAVERAEIKVVRPTPHRQSKLDVVHARVSAKRWELRWPLVRIDYSA